MEYRSKEIENLAKGAKKLATLALTVYALSGCSGGGGGSGSTTYFVQAPPTPGIPSAPSKVEFQDGEPEDNGTLTVLVYPSFQGSEDADTATIGVREKGVLTPTLKISGAPIDESTGIATGTFNYLNNDKEYDGFGSFSNKIGQEGQANITDYPKKP